MFRLLPLVFLLAAGVMARDVVTPAIVPESMAWEECLLIADGGEEPLPADVVREILGWPREYGPLRAWRIAMHNRPGMAPDYRYSLQLHFTRPLAIGSMRVAGATVRYLPAGEPRWVTPDVPPNQTTPTLPLPPRTMVTAISLDMIVSKGGRPTEPFLAAYRQRLANLAPLAVANADSEYRVEPRMSAPFTLSAANLVTGKLHWQNVGPDPKTGKILHRALISDVAPSWIVLSWPDEQELDALLVEGNGQEVAVQHFVGPANLNPAIATGKEWRTLRIEPKRQAYDREGQRLTFNFEETIRTRALRVLITRTAGGAVATITSLQALRSLGDAPVPDLTPPSQDKPPFRLAYALPEKGIFTMVIDGPDGKPRRNLLARRERDGGENAEPWNLKDDDGRYVAPGTYQWRGIWHPGLTLHYEMTPFPNIGDHSPENAPWLTGHNGTGGWLADHTPSAAVLAYGDRIYIGSEVAEGGVALLEADLRGRKLWGHHNFMAWTGPTRMAAAEEQLFVHAFRDGTDHIWQIDLASREVNEILTRAGSASRRSGIKGIEARGEKLYLAVKSDANSWLVNAFSDGDVDLANSWPRYPRPEERDEEEHDPADDFVRLFRLRGTPPGQHGALTWLETTRGREPRQHIVLACNRPVPIGSLVLPVPDLPRTALQFSYMKDDAPYPPDPENEEHWQRFATGEGQGWTVIPAPEGLTTRALRITFHQGGDEELAGLLEGLEEESARKAWSGRLEGLKILRRRYAPCPPPTIDVSSGTVEADGSWLAQRETPISPEAPAVYMMQWTAPETMRGLAIKEVDGREVRVDSFTGTADDPVQLADDANWEEVASLQPSRRYFYPGRQMNADARYLDQYVDFGRDITTRAVRLRIISQWTERAQGREGLYGIREDRGGMTLDPTRAAVHGVVALRHLGGEPPVDPLIAERLETFDWQKREMVGEMPLDGASDLAFAESGELFALSGSRVLRLDLADGAHVVVIDDLIAPKALAIDATGQFYLFDGAPERQTVRVYSAEGSYLRSIGTPGGFQAGGWDPTRMGSVSDLAIDQSGQLWVNEKQHFPKRVSRWRLDGSFVAEHFDRTIYGGGGVLDPRDKSLLYYGPLEFELNWESGRTALRNLTTIGDAPAGEQPVYLGERKYLVTRDRFFMQPVGIVYRYDDGTAILAAAMGAADQFPPLKKPDVLVKIGAEALANLQFLWSDLDGDGAVQPQEIEFSPRQVRTLTNFDDRLGITGDNMVWRVREVLPSGVPVYEQLVLPLPARGQYYQLPDNRLFSFGEAAVYTEEGELLWRYRTEGTGVHAYYKASPLTPEQVVSEFSIVARDVMTRGGLGEHLITTSNTGIWHIWTGDGLLAGNIFLDLRHPHARRWNMDTHDRGMELRNLTAGQEHFWGDVTQTADGNVYGIWMSTNVFRIDGMDRFQRLTGSFEVTEEDLQRALAWEQQLQARDVYERARLAIVPAAPRAVRVDGEADDWDGVPATSLHGDARDFNATFRASHDDKNLYLLYETIGMGPLANSGEDWRRLFKSGGAVDLQLATNPSASPERRHAGVGDIRLLMTRLKGKPVAVLYEALIPDADKADDMVFETQVFRTVFSRVRMLDTAKLAVVPTENGYRVEAAIPLAELNLRPIVDQMLRFDWGILRTGDEGREVLGRHYWSNQATAILSDIAAEAQLAPHLWGHLRFTGKADGALRMPGEGTSDPVLDDLLNELD